MVFQPYDQNYKFLSNEGYIFSYLISKSARFESSMAIVIFFEKIFVSVRKSKNVLILAIIW